MVMADGYESDIGFANTHLNGKDDEYEIVDEYEGGRYFTWKWTL